MKRNICLSLNNKDRAGSCKLIFWIRISGIYFAAWFTHCHVWMESFLGLFLESQEKASLFLASRTGPGGAKETGMSLLHSLSLKRKLARWIPKWQNCFPQNRVQEEIGGWRRGTVGIFNFNYLCLQIPVWFAYCFIRGPVKQPPLRVFHCSTIFWQSRMLNTSTSTNINKKKKFTLQFYFSFSSWPRLSQQQLTFLKDCR